MTLLRNFFRDKQLREYNKGQIILYQAEETSSVFYIKSGYVKVYDVTASGDERLVLVLGEGDVFPLIWTFRASDTMRYFYETMADTSLLVATRKQLLENINQDHEFTKDLLKYTVNNIMQLYLRIECIEASNAKRKIMQVLDYLIKAHPGKTIKNLVQIPLPLTHQHIANMAGLSRETASINLKELENDKIWVVSDSGYAINQQKLNRLLDE